MFEKGLFELHECQGHYSILVKLCGGIIVFDIKFQVNQSNKACFMAESAKLVYFPLLPMQNSHIHAYI